MPTTIDTVLEQIGRYFGVVSRHSFTSMLVQGTANGQSVPNVTPGGISERIASELISITDGGLPTPELIREINEKLTSANESDRNELLSAIRICYESSFTGDTAGVMLKRDKRQSFSVVGPQGTDNDNAYSLRSLCKIPGESKANAHDGVGGPGTNTFSIVQVFRNRLSPASRDMGALTFFMQGIPTIEMSRAVPFIDIVLIQQGAHLEGNDKRISRLSMGQFLLGNSTGHSPSAQLYLNANDSQVSLDNASVPEFEPSARSQGGTTQTQPIPIATAGMEIFTSPQTLVPADEMHTEGDIDNPGTTLNRSTPVLDRFRPLMSLKNASFSVAASGGMMSYKSGKLSLTLHDKSRLAEVAAFVRPSLYGTTHLQIEYGWAHPAAKIHGGGEMTEEENLIGKFIGALRVKEKYQVVNSSFSFDNSGQVEIDMSIAMLSASASQQVNISFDFESTTEYQNLVAITEIVKQIRARLDENTAASITGEQDILGALSSPLTALSLSEETLKAISDLRNSNLLAREDRSPDIRRLGTAISSFIGETKDGSKGAYGKARSSLQNKIGQMVQNLKNDEDPFFLKSTASSPSKVIDSPRNFVSLGKVMATFVASKLAQSGNFRDVQMIFYNFNEKASYMSNRNIASFPIEYDDFEKVMKKAIDQLADMNVSKFMNLMSLYYLHDPGSPAYGFNDLYKDRSEEDFSSRELRENYQAPGRQRPVNLSEDNAAFMDAEQRTLRQAYSSLSSGQQSAAGEVSFKMPTIQAYVETVPIRETAQTGGDTGHPKAEVMLRIHIFDSQASSYATLQSFLEASSDKSISTLNAAAQAAIAGNHAVTSSTASQNTPAQNQTNSTNSKEFTAQIKAALDANLLEPWPPSQEPVQIAADALRPPRGQRYRMKGGFHALKQFVSRTMPSMRYGEGASGILNASVTTMSDPALTSINMLRQGRSPDSPTGHRAQGLPLQIAPVECNLETIGCPLWNFGQQVFIDFGTGTTVDAIYGVTGIEHSIGPGEFKTSVKLTPMNSYAKYQSMFDQLENALTAIEGITEPNQNNQGS